MTGKIKKTENKKTFNEYPSGVLIPFLNAKDYSLTDKDKIEVINLTEYEIFLWNKEQKSISSYSLKDIDQIPLKGYHVKLALLGMKDLNINTIDIFRDKDKNWRSQRKEVHTIIIREVFNSALQIAQNIKNSNSFTKGIYAIKGSSGSGKSTLAKGILSELGLTTTQGIISTDYLKKKLIEHSFTSLGSSPSMYQVHKEGSLLKKKILNMLLADKISFILDTRLDDILDIQDLIKHSRETNLPINVYECRTSPLSAGLRMLSRNGIFPSDPTPPFKSFEKSLDTTHKNYIDFINIALSSDRVRSYTIYEDKKSYSIKTNFKLTSPPPKPPNQNIENIDKYNLNSQDTQHLTMAHQNRIINLTLKEALDKIAQDSIRISKESYFQVFMKNILDTSRSVHGTINTSASFDKKDKIIYLSQQETKSNVQSNLINSFEFIHINKNIYLPSKDHLKEFILLIARKVNHKILKEDSSLLRVDKNSSKYNYVQTEYVEQFFESFIDQLFEKINNHFIDKRELSAWIEWNIDFTGHIFSDGCGRIAKTVSTWILMRYNHPLPVYALGQGSYDNIRSSYRKQFTPKEKILFSTPTLTKEFDRFLQYYLKLF